MEEAEKSLWISRKCKELVVDTSAAAAPPAPLASCCVSKASSVLGGHIAYAKLDNGLDQPDVMISLLAWSRWGLMLSADSSTLAIVG